MNCNCRWAEFVLALVVVVFAAWPTFLFSAATSRWLVIIAGLILLVHSFMHHGSKSRSSSGSRSVSNRPKKSAKKASKSKKKKRK